tara:strand:- start:5967 stop:6668 length:702 start_codon:yes stop_codon:yes gene_type:complete
MSKSENISSGKQTETMNVEVWSDVVCPFCYIGKRNFENALKQTGLTDNVNVVWRSFELAPDLRPNPEATIYEELCKRKGWSLEQSKQIHRQMEQRAKESGLTFDFSQTVPANSFNAHRLLHLAGRHGVQNEVKESLFKGYFTDGKNIDDENFLIETGRKAGINEEEVRNALQSDDIEKEIVEDIEIARKMGINGVPYFVLNQKYALSGAQPVDQFIEALAKARGEMSLDAQQE